MEPEPFELFPRERKQIAPGAVHVPDWLDAEHQRELLRACREWARPPAGLRTVRTPGGGTMTARQVCLGWHWYPYAYARTVVDGDGSPVKPFPDRLRELGRRAVRDALGEGAGQERPGAPVSPYDTNIAEPAPAYDIALINFYDADARMGMHRDSDEKSDAPVVSLSLGDTCVFRFGNTESRGRPYTDVELRSGDLFVFGGPSRLAYHGVPKVQPGTAPPELGLTGRLNITLRVSGL
ncbi:alpha-ketoglutarate-dependent dioxygenase AlkB family protein [Streptomyces sp. HGB0020]|uniref:alpha-ketoglutarate-dependent dioxygenase AlkB family protein n=1 Tax=Streptomyces sp. HGB0020 TaxID=1078086 RepID=UPI00034E9D63|nr:alpha-ketoglutarate-dependent dioxygenase AlkB [Streptomyces sp. HGB0020]EPD63256.1 alkylated DNA repair protein AlkB [Streptomyces sp. HGB0020]